MKAALGETPLAIASGITAENIGDYLPIADIFLVATGISRTFEELDRNKVIALVERVRSYSPPSLPASRPPGEDPRWTQDEDALPADWAQRAVYGQPLLGRSFREVVGRISQWNSDDAVVLRLFGHRLCEGPALVELLRSAGCSLAAVYSKWRSSSAAPIEDGYLRCIRLRPGRGAGDELVDPVATISAFVGAETRRFELQDIEVHLREHYGELSETQRRDLRFNYIDYPAFDSGTTAVGFGLLIHTDIWVWSRVVHHHK